MNKQQAIEILNNLQQVFRDEEDIENALDFAIKELWKDDRKYEAEIMAWEILAWVYKTLKDEIWPPDFAWKCTKCGDPAESPEYTLCKHHFALWQSSKRDRVNYKYLVNIDSPKEVRDYYNIWDIYSNIWECPKCWDIIESLNHYDYTKCSCWHSFVDGGSDYMRCNPDLINLSIWFNQK